MVGIIELAVVWFYCGMCLVVCRWSPALWLLVGCVAFVGVLGWFCDFCAWVTGVDLWVDVFRFAGLVCLCTGSGLVVLVLFAIVIV